MGNIVSSKISSVWGLYHPSTAATISNVRKVMYKGDQQIHISIGSVPSVLFTKDASGNIEAKYLSSKDIVFRYKEAFDTFPRFISFDSAGNVKETAALDRWRPPGSVAVDVEHFIEMAASCSPPSQLVYWVAGDTKTSRVTRSAVLQAFLLEYIGSQSPPINSTYIWSIFYERLPSIVDNLTLSAISALTQAIKRECKK